VILGTVGIALTLIEQSTADYVAGAAAAWIVFGRTLLAAQERREQEQGALAQEVFDIEVLRLPWNAATAGVQPAPEDLRNWGERQPPDSMRDWYADVRPARHPVDALICQRSSVTWARQDHATYARVLRVIGGAALVATILLGIALSMNLGEYLLRLGLPVLPAVLDIFDIASANDAIGRRRVLIAEEADRLYTRARDSAVAPSEAECRRLQDEIYGTRRVMGIPDWFYRLTRRRRQRNMEEVAREQVERLPPSLREDMSV
jgi:hypothetical protein